MKNLIIKALQKLFATHGEVGKKLAVIALRLAHLMGFIQIAGIWHVVIRDRFGNLKEEFTYQNLITNEGLTHIAGVVLGGDTQITAWYLALTSGSPTPAAGDTLASHGGWTEFTDYDETARPAFSDGGAASQSIDNTASPATFTSSSNGNTVGGAFLVSDNTKGGTTGKLFSVGAFPLGDKNLDTGETVQVDVTYTFTSS
nr:hypothetical protein 19 [bacterium]